MFAPLQNGLIGEVQGAAARAAFVEGFVKTDQAIGLGKRERTKQRAFDDGEDGGIRADPEGERSNRDDAEGRRFPEKSERVADVVHNIFEFRISIFDLAKIIRRGGLRWD
jgi:hypothetical protein